MPDSAPLEFRYIGHARDFPAKEALETILRGFILHKLDALPKEGLTFLGKGEDDPSVPGDDEWERFDYSREDVIALLDDPAAAGKVGRFAIERTAEKEYGADEDGDRVWIAVEADLVADYSAAALTLRFLQNILGGPVQCQCWVRYAEGDGQDLRALAALLKT